MESARKSAEQSLEKKKNLHEQQLETVHQKLKELGQKYADCDTACAALVSQRASIEKRECLLNGWKNTR